MLPFPLLKTDGSPIQNNPFLCAKQSLCNLSLGAYGTTFRLVTTISLTKSNCVLCVFCESLVVFVNVLCCFLMNEITHLSAWIYRPTT